MALAPTAAATFNFHLVIVLLPVFVFLKSVVGYSIDNSMHYGLSPLGIWNLRIWQNEYLRPHF